jgi:hypothetical protein
MASAWKLGLIWFVSVAIVSAIASARTARQGGGTPDVPLILSSSDLGFRIDSFKGGSPLGTLMVRVEGRWVEAGWAPKISRVK